MTYEEDYRKAKTLEELEEKVNSDMVTARIIGSSDRMKIIKKVAEKVANEKFGEE